MKVKTEPQIQGHCKENSWALPAVSNFYPRPPGDSLKIGWEWHVEKKHSIIGWKFNRFHVSGIQILPCIYTMNLMINLIRGFHVSFRFFPGSAANAPGAKRPELRELKRDWMPWMFFSPGMRRGCDLREYVWQYVEEHHIFSSSGPLPYLARCSTCNILIHFTYLIPLI